MANQGSRSNQAQFNIVGEGTVFEGTLRAESNVNVSGRVVGTLIVNGRAVISKNGVVEGELRATNAAIGGTIEGEVYVEERLELESSAHVDGSIQTDRLVVEEGAIFTGTCKMGDAVTEPAIPEAKAPSKKNGNASSAKEKDTPPEKGGAKGSPKGRAKEDANKGATSGVKEGANDAKAARKK
jgi:cytoskeletal protein CcmA (bactofilin family)